MMRVFALIPAAGQSRRMGRPKLALPLGGSTVLQRVVGAALAGGVDEVLVVIAPATAFLKPLAEQAGAKVLLLSEETPDMRATVEAGLAWVRQQHQPSDEDDAWLLLPADHPTIQPDVIKLLLVNARLDPDASIFVPSFQGRRGHPTLFRWKHVDGLRKVPAGQGLNAYVRGLPEETMEMHWRTSDVLRDLDTPEDYDRLVKEASRSSDDRP